MTEYERQSKRGIAGADGTNSPADSEEVRDTARSDSSENPRAHASDTQVIAASMKPWLISLGVAFMFLSLPYAFTGQGLIVAWVPLWLGILLIQAGKGAGRKDVREVLHRLKMFAVVLTITIGVMAVFSVLSILLATYPSFARWLEWSGF